MSSKRAAVFMALALMLVGSACVRPTRERLVVLGSSSAPATSPDGAAAVSLGRLSVPEYLDGYDVITRISPHELQRADGSRWAERLPDAAARVLRAALAANGVRVDDDAANVVSVEIAAFEGTADGVVVLSATWEVHDRDRQPLVRSNWATEQRSGPGAPAQAAAMELALQGLAVEMAATIKALPAGEPAYRAE
jgi:uncharacterized lipoprotein YmbA